MICPKCGSHVPDNSKYCPLCGTEQHPTVTPSKENQQNTQNSCENNFQQQNNCNNGYNNYGNNNNYNNQGYNQQNGYNSNNTNSYNGYQQNIYNNNGYSYPSGKATTALVLGILSIFCVGVILGPISIVYGKNYLDAVKAGQADPANSSKAQAGFILGIIGIVLCVVCIIASL